MENANRSSNGIWIFIRMVLVLALVVAVIYLIFRLLKNNGIVPSEDDQFLRRISYLPIGNNKSVQIISLIDHAYILGVSDNNINLISEINDKELIDAMNLYSDKKATASKPRNFADILDLFMPRKKDSSAPLNAFNNESSERILTSLKNQKERLNNNEE